ncbi:DUF1778 domain-containing protein [Luteolibacter sp. LG18]|uniref:type II toxin -antitoxin system TacA 1-like antitoxin n=1 Tax=Luteolibacter sp. LG18 TaxID=2819286 RepID=UPI0030C741FE
MKATRKPGRPPSSKAAPTVRISPHFPEALAERVRQASALRGLSVVSFVMEAARREAERVIEEEGRLRFTEEETRTLATLLARPPKANAAARKAATRAAGVEIRS